jgi:hypothetical protein
VPATRGRSAVTAEEGGRDSQSRKNTLLPFARLTFMPLRTLGNYAGQAIAAVVSSALKFLERERERERGEGGIMPSENSSLL